MGEAKRRATAAQQTMAVPVPVPADVRVDMAGERIAVIEAQTTIRSVVTVADDGDRLRIEVSGMAAYLSADAARELQRVIGAWLAGRN